MNKGTVVLVAWVMMVVAFFINGYTLSVLWSWFIVSKFGLPALTIAEALGLALVVSYFTFNHAKHEWNDNSDEEKVFRLVLMPFLKAGIFLGFGWVFLQFI